MRKDIAYHVWPRDLRFEDKLSLLGEFAAERGLQFNPDSEDSVFRLQVDRNETVWCGALEELVAYMKRHPAYEGFTAGPDYQDDEAAKSLSVLIRKTGRAIQVEVWSEDIDLVESTHTMIREEFRLSNPAIPLGDGTRDKWLNPTVFVARHFDARGDEYFASLEAFLRLLGFDVKQGREYTSKPIPTKVRDRIDSQDIFIAVVSGDQTSEWLIAEPAYAVKDKHIVLMVEEGASYETTLLGQDLEQIRFPPGQIEKTFIPLLQEFTSVRVKGIF